jgi:hypothetical protein
MRAVKCAGQLSFDDLIGPDAADSVPVRRAIEPRQVAALRQYAASMSRAPASAGVSPVRDPLWWTTVRPESRPPRQPLQCTFPACGELAPIGRKRCDAHKPGAAGVRQPKPAVRVRRPVPPPGVIQPPSAEYSEVIPELPGFYVYRLWAADGICLYVGMVGKRGPRRVDQRFSEHEDDRKAWWRQVARIEVRSFAVMEGAEAEERHQIATLMPVWNKQGTGTQVCRGMVA